MQKNNKLKEQAIPLVLTFITFLALVGFLAITIFLLNLLPNSEKISLEIRKRDILVGLTIYLKTAIDFAIFIGNLMKSNPGWKSRISIELGTAFGNAVGTLVILAIWNFFREVPALMAIMIFLASLVLLRMAEESLEELIQTKNSLPDFLNFQLRTLQFILRIPNKYFSPILKLISPKGGLTNTKSMPFFSLFLFSMSVPFILGLDDFAGYIPLFSIINVFGFAIGVFLGHMILNAALFVSPSRTIILVKHPLILLLGGLAFVGIAGWGFYEVAHIVLKIATH